MFCKIRGSKMNKLSKSEIIKTLDKSLLEYFIESAKKEQSKNK